MSSIKLRGHRVIAVVLCASSAFTLLSSVHAQTSDSAVAFAPVVVSGARLEQRLPETLPATQVITRDEIERSQAPDALTLLRRLAGVEVAQTGGIGAQAGVFLRGASGRSALVLVDGVPINNLNFGTAAIDQLTTAQIERIEVVTGSVGALYGAQASGGVIQIFTREGGGAPRAEASIGYGSRNTREGRAALLGSSGGLRYGVDLSGYATRGFDATNKTERPGTNPDDDGYRNTSGAAHVAYAIDGGHEIGARFTRSRGVIEYDSEFGPPEQTNRSTQIIETASAYAKTQLTSLWSARFGSARSSDKLDANETAFPYFVRTATTQYSWDNTVQLAEGWTATAALERLRQTIASDTQYARDQRTVNSARAGVNGRIGPHTVQINARHDDTSDFGRRTTWYAGYGFDVAPGWRASASASTGFNAPSFNDLFFPFGGNPDLRPETSKSYEAALQYSQAATFARASLFTTRYRDLIGFDSSFNTVNIGRAKAEGLEASAGTSLEGWRIRASATLQEARDEVTDTRLVRRARAFGNATVIRAFGPIEVEANWRVTGDRRDRALGQDRTLAAYGVVDLAARWTFARDWSGAARIENLFDRKYENVYGYNPVPFGAFVSLRYAMR